MQLRFIPGGLLAGLLMLVGCESVAPTAVLAPGEAALASGTQTNEWVTVDRVVDDPCAEEAVHIFGRAHVKVKESTDKNGVTKLRMQINYAGVRGVGLVSGREYVVHGNSKDVSFASPSGEYESVLKDTFMLVSKGKDANYKTHFVAVFRIDANGEVTQEIEERSSCQ